MKENASTVAHEALKPEAQAWFEALRDRICAAFEAIEDAGAGMDLPGPVGPVRTHGLDTPDRGRRSGRGWRRGDEFDAGPGVRKKSG